MISRSFREQVRRTPRCYLLVLFVALLLLIRILFFNAPNDAAVFLALLLQNKSLSDFEFPIHRIYHHDGIAYDYYSQHDLGRSNAPTQWEFWPLSNDTYEANDHSSALAQELSPSVVSKLPFVDAIYLMTDPTLTQRHVHLRNALLRQGVSIDQIQWRFKWNKTTCNAPSNHEHVYQRFNLKEKPLGISQNPAS